MEEGTLKKSLGAALKNKNGESNGCRRPAWEERGGQDLGRMVAKGEHKQVQSCCLFRNLIVDDARQTQTVLDCFRVTEVSLICRWLGL